MCKKHSPAVVGRVGLKYFLIRLSNVILHFIGKLSWNVHCKTKLIRASVAAEMCECYPKEETKKARCLRLVRRLEIIFIS